MSEDSLREIQIGDTNYKIRRFKGLKATLAGALMSRVMRELPELQERISEFRKNFRTRNTLTITPAMAKLPRFEALGLTTEDFAAAGGNIELPEEPDTGTILMQMFPDLFELAQKELQKFFAIIVIPNSDLEAADDADEVEEELGKLGKKLMRQGDLDELLELLVVGLEVLKEQMASKRDRLGKLPIPIIQYLLGEEEQPEESNGHGPVSEIPSETDPPLSPSSPPPLSSDSPSTDGADERLSTTSPGAS